MFSSILERRLVLSVIAAALLAESAPAQDRTRLAVGYDEGLALRYFLNDRAAIQGSVSVEYLGGYEATANNTPPGAQNPEINYGFGAAFLYCLYKGERVFLDALGQVAYAFDGTRLSNDIQDRNWSFLRFALAPEILLGGRLGLGARFGVEVASRSDSRDYLPPPNQATIGSTDDAYTNVRFFGPRNPFNGPVLGLSMYYYFGE